MLRLGHRRTLLTAPESGAAPLPLDALISEGASLAFAVSPARLLTSFVGASIRLRSDGAGSPEQDASFTAAGDLDTAAITTWLASTSGSNAYARTFYDQSGNGRNLGNATAAQQPLYGDGSNGKGRLVFDGSNDHLDTASFSLAQPFLIWVVLSTAEVAALRYHCSTIGTAPTFGGLYKNTSVAGGYFGTSNSGLPTYSVNTLSHLCCYVNGSSSWLNLNGSLATGLAWGATGINGGWRIGDRFDGAMPWNGSIVEQVIFSGDPTGLAGWTAFYEGRRSYFGLP